MSMKNFLMRKMLASKMKDVPQAEQDKIFNMLEKNPDLFQKIAMEVQEEVKKGKDQMSAMMEITKKYESDIKNLL
jgi:2-oxo-4-hydroxy-4-carboxy--5-ureidoimidazoline (OHCU) decarboxylase